MDSHDPDEQLSEHLERELRRRPLDRDKLDAYAAWAVSVPPTYVPPMVTVSRRVYRGVADTPKSGKPKLIALPPPAKDALMELPSYETGGLVFRSIKGAQLTPPIMGGYWRRVLDAAGCASTGRCT